jgi:DNA-binding NarL/FixJ family response regulator
VRVAEPFGQENLDGLAEQLGAREAEQSLGLRIDEGDAPVGADDDDGVRRGLEECPERRGVSRKSDRAGRGLRRRVSHAGTVNQRLVGGNPVAGRAVEPVRLLIVEDSAPLAEALLFAFGFEADMAAVGVAPSIGRALEIVEAEQPDVVLMDVRLPDGSGIRAASQVMALRPGTGVIVMTARADNAIALEAAEAGAAGFLLKDVRIARIVGGIRRVAAGAIAVEPALLAALLAQAAGGPSAADGVEAKHDLSVPEQTVLGLLTEGLDGLAMAERMGIPETEVADAAASMRTRLGARSNFEAVIHAARAGLLGPGQGSSARISNR